MGILRVSLALAVVLVHSTHISFFSLPDGTLVVPCFFIVSGFYMSLILSGKYSNNGYWIFISNRLLRIMPMYWGALVITLITCLASGFFFNEWLLLKPWMEYSGIIRKIGILILLILTNIGIVGQDTLLFLGFTGQGGAIAFLKDFRTSTPQLWEFLLIPQAWSLSLEICFYLIAPLIVRSNSKILLFLISASLLLRIFIYRHFHLTGDPWSYRFLPTEFSLFFLGVFVFRYRDFINSLFKKIRVRVPLAIFYFGIFIAYNYSPGGEIKRWFFFAFTGIILPVLFELTKSNKIDRRIGELSYPIYIIHFIITSFLLVIINKLKFPVIYHGLFACVFSMLIAYVFLIAIIDPIDKLRQKRVAVI